MPVNRSIQQNLILIKNDPSKILGLTIGIGKHNPQPGDYIPEVDAQPPPELSFKSLNLSLDSSKTYMVVGLDIDAPFPSLDVLGPILHWIQPDFKVDKNSLFLKSAEPFVANYISPGPPPGSAPHRYIFFLYEQPSQFDGKKYAPPGGKKLSNWNRMRCSLDEWEKKAGLDSVLAVNYFKSD
ncbi:uncharacterized protein Z518_10163 [Rhinocladiella mackenziei CBS 650.93]|uniref:Carboxypeptidase Y inhibitor n=1 Tax=Rhinocladiella mackenziei CBS 650.93 TaxID=1442369 RepID=A0A0D2FGH7_9EURO|nr:uncharacterized protein Z518_10163 [Rhinocladiella mackenziei CBS 650.93]KIX01097.1 hypothetical protein Z518_10163 [Rhinocladiella mackenziei CBS 650.93]